MKLNLKFRAAWLMFTIAALVSSCRATYYERSLGFQQAFESGDPLTALNRLNADKKLQRNKNQLLYYMNAGTLYSITGMYDSSNAMFEKAYSFIEDTDKNKMQQALAVISNPEAIDYRGEDHEILFIHYYKALNYLKLGLPDKSLVECKRMNDKLNRLSDKYKSDKKYRRDAFIHTLMGVIYDANKEYNNAFIAYRNALEIYKEDYEPLFGIKAPNQLKQDLIRTAELTGFEDYSARYRKEFSMQSFTYPKERNTGEIVFIWHNGLGPIKSEENIFMNVVKGQGGNMMLVNEKLNLNINFPLPQDNNDKAGLDDFRFFKVSLPKYNIRNKALNTAFIKIGDDYRKFEVSEDVTAIAMKTLQERYTEEIAKVAVRLAAKKIAEHALRQQNEAAGAAMGVVNLITEKADTRNWQTLPSAISYMRISLPAGERSFEFTTNAQPGGTDPFGKTYQVNLKAGETRFFTHHTFDFDRRNFTSR